MIIMTKHDDFLFSTNIVNLMNEEKVRSVLIPAVFRKIFKELNLDFFNLSIEQRKKLILNTESFFSEDNCVNSLDLKYEYERMGKHNYKTFFADLIVYYKLPNHKICDKIFHGFTLQAKVLECELSEFSFLFEFKIEKDSSDIGSILRQMKKYRETFCNDLYFLVFDELSTNKYRSIEKIMINEKIHCICLKVKDNIEPQKTDKQLCLVKP